MTTTTDKTSKNGRTGASSHSRPATSGDPTPDAAAQTSIGAATRELHLPTVRTEAADIAQRERHTHLAYLAEVLAAEVDDRTERRRARRIADARFPRLKRLAEFNIDAVPTIPAATLGHLAAGHYHQPTRDYVERRSAEGLSKREIIRCLKRYIAREIYTHLPRPAALDTSGQLEHAA